MDVVGRWVGGEKENDGRVEGNILGGKLSHN